MDLTNPQIIMRDKEIAQLRAELAKERNKLEMAEAVIAGDGALITGLKNDLAAAQIDAKRYRWLRDKSQPQNRNGPGLYWYLPRFMQGTKEEQLDAAIDNALREASGKESRSEQTSDSI